MATTERMSVHKCLAELKTMDKRIIDAIDTGKYCIANKHSNMKISGITLTDYRAKMQGDYDRATSLIKRRNAMKKALVLSNAVTIVKINDIECTVAEAIEMKNHGVEYDQYLLEELKKQYHKEQSIITMRNGDELERKAEKYIVEMYGSNEDAKKGENASLAKKEYIEQNSYDFIDEIKIVDKIRELETKINDFLVEIDSALSVSNSLTEIEFTY